MSEVIYKYVRGKGWIPDPLSNPDAPQVWYVVYRMPGDVNWRNAIETRFSFQTYKEAYNRYAQFLNSHSYEIRNYGWAFSVTISEH